MTGKKEYPILSFKNNTINFNSYVKVYTSPKLNNVVEDINQKNNTSINLIVLGDWNEFYCYRINIMFSKNKNMNFSWKLVKPSIWNLSDELDKVNSKKNCLVRRRK